MSSLLAVSRSSEGVAGDGGVGGCVTAASDLMSKRPESCVGNLSVILLLVTAIGTETGPEEEVLVEVTSFLPLNSLSRTLSMCASSPSSRDRLASRAVEASRATTLDAWNAAVWGLSPVVSISLDRRTPTQRYIRLPSIGPIACNSSA